MSDDQQQLISPTFVFHFSVPCQRLDAIWSDDMELPEEYRIPSFGELEERPMFADLRMGWHENGMAISLRTSGKKQATWCRQSRLEDSDGLALLLDSRHSRQNHRANRFCHHFCLLPHGGGRQLQDPVAQLVPINRAQENPKPLTNGMIKIRAEKRIDGYLLRAAIPAEAITGYSPDEAHEIGFAYAVKDRELGWQTFSVSNEFPLLSDPTLWGTMQLLR